ncbi:MYG1 family protein [Anaerobutyricum hallii]|uniref:MYG1 family protein n=1 Tax=Anaerobutyricum hallii TaxID=39488 RepID=UPI00399AC53C
MNTLLKQIKKKNAKAFTHGGKFHADDVFSSALLLYFNPEITITRGNKVSEDFEGIIFDIGRGKYDHHQKNSRIRENGIPYAAFGLLWEELGKEILGEELAAKFDESFIQPLDINDNTGEKNELATLIGNFNPSWYVENGENEAFSRAVQTAGMILVNMFEKYKGNERAEKRVEEILAAHNSSVLSGEKSEIEAKILVLPEFVPCQKQLRETDIAFIIFPSNRGGYCIQPLKKEHSLNYKCSFPESWFGLEGEELKQATGLTSANFCHKGGFIMTVDDVNDAISACKISLENFTESSCIINLVGSHEMDESLKEIPHMENATIIHLDLPEMPTLTFDGNFGEISMEKSDFKSYIKDYVKKILKYKPDAVYIEGELLIVYPVIRVLHKKHIPVYIKHQNGVVAI